VKATITEIRNPPVATKMKELKGIGKPVAVHHPIQEGAHMKLPRQHIDGIIVLIESYKNTSNYIMNAALGLDAGNDHRLAIDARGGRLPP
jgi:hypothetical protein